MVIYITTSPYGLDLTGANTQLLNLAEVRLLPDTTSGAKAIMLPDISDFPQQNVKIYITDYLGNAGTNPITVYAHAGNTINGTATNSISTDNGFLKLEIGSASEWIAEGAAGGGSGGSVTNIPITTADFVGNEYQDNRLIGKQPIVNFNVFVNVGVGVAANGTVVNPGDVYDIDDVTGTLTMEPDNYLIQIYS